MPDPAKNEQLNSTCIMPVSSRKADQDKKDLYERLYSCIEQEMPDSENTDALVNAAVVKCIQGFENADIGDLMQKGSRYAYVRACHRYPIVLMKEDQTLSGYWRTYYYVDGKRKVIYRKDKSDLMDFLYRLYKEGEGSTKRFEAVFNELMEYKREFEQCSEKTIEGWQRYYDRYLSGLGKSRIGDLKNDDLVRYIIKVLAPMKLKTDAMNHTICVLKKVFWFARKREYIKDSPEEGINYREYRRFTDRSRKFDEDSYFSIEETEKIRQFEWDHIDNPRALITLMCIETGMRADEPVALHVEDIRDGYIEIHRQQLRIDHPKPYRFVEVDYTKDTRTSECTSRYFPITPRIQEIIDEALKLPGESVYLFHDAEGNMIKKDSYELYLRRHVRSLGINGKSNNHAFRKGLNTNVLIPRGIPVNTRSALLGHKVQTNERNYSPRRTGDMQKLAQILAKGPQELEV